MVDINWVDPLKYMLGFAVGITALYTAAYAFAYGFSSAWTQAKLGARRHHYRLDLIDSIKAEMGVEDEEN